LESEARSSAKTNHRLHRRLPRYCQHRRRPPVAPVAREVYTNFIANARANADTNNISRRYDAPINIPFAILVHRCIGILVYRYIRYISQRVCVWDTSVTLPSDIIASSIFHVGRAHASDFKSKARRIFPRSPAATLGSSDDGRRLLLVNSSPCRGLVANGQATLAPAGIPHGGLNGRWMANGTRGAASWFNLSRGTEARKKGGGGGECERRPDNPRSAADRRSAAAVS